MPDGEGDLFADFCEDFCCVLLVEGQAARAAPRREADESSIGGAGSGGTCTPGGAIRNGSLAGAGGIAGENTGSLPEGRSISEDIGGPYPPTG